MPSADRSSVPFGPEVSWPSGYSDLEYAHGDYRYPATRAEQLPAAGQGAHPYAAFNGSGYGDDGYHDPGYQGPAAQDSGITGTRTVQGYVDSGQGQPGYPPPGYARSSYLPPTAPHRQPGYAESAGYPGPGYAADGIGTAYPPSAASRGPDLYSQPWDYDQPLRYEGEEDSYIDYRRAGAPDGRENDGAVRYQSPAYDPAAYNGSDYSMPGVNGPGYDLSGIIGTSDFEAIGYDEPSYRRLSYDDPRYDDTPRYPQPGQRFRETSREPRRFDETRLDEMWLSRDAARRNGGPAGFGTGGGTGSRSRSEAPGADRGRGARAAETRFDMKALAETGAKTRFDMKALAEPGDNTRFDVPRFDETRLDNLRAPARGLRTSGATALAPSAAKPRNWAEDTSLDHFADLDLTDEPVPAAFTRTLERPDARPLELPQGQDDDTATRRAVGKRRGRSSDRRQWMALGAIAIVTAGAIGGVLMKYKYAFAGSSGPAHTVVAPQKVDGFSRSANLEKQLNVAGEAQTVAKESSGQATGVAYGVYQMGNLTPGSNTQMFMFVGGKLTGADPAASVANFEQHYPGAKTVQPGSLGGQEACTETEVNNQSASMCVWFDNDTFGAVVSPTMTTAKLGTTMNAVRPSLELYQK